MLSVDPKKRLSAESLLYDNYFDQVLEQNKFLLQSKLSSEIEISQHKTKIFKQNLGKMENLKT